MSKKLKPNDINLNDEISFKVIGCKQWNDLGNTDTCGLFDGKAISDDWGVVENFYFSSKDCYVEIQTDEKCNIWRLANITHPSYCGKLKIERKDKSGFVNITEEIKQDNNEIQGDTWMKTISNLPKGHYRFSLFDTENLRMDNEWFLEKSYLIKMLFKFKEEYYTFDKGLVKKLDSFSNTSDFFIKNGFDDMSLIDYNYLQKYFDLNKLQLLLWMDETNYNVEMNYKLKNPFIPIKKFSGNLEIIAFNKDVN